MFNSLLTHTKILSQNVFSEVGQDYQDFQDHARMDESCGTSWQHAGEKNPVHPVNPVSKCLFRVWTGLSGFSGLCQDG
jgi:hypothetical protein